MKIKLTVVFFSHASLAWPSGYYFSTDEEPAITTGNSVKCLSFPLKVIYSSSKLSAWIAISRILDFVYIQYLSINV